MPSPDELLARVAELESAIRVLQSESEQLAERAEDTLLLSLLAEELSAAETPESVLSRGLERISILKNVPLCAACSTENQNATTIAAFASRAQHELRGVTIALTPELRKELLAESVFVNRDDCRQLDFSEVTALTGFEPRCVLLVPVHSRPPVPDLFVFADDDDGERLPEMSLMLHRGVEMMATRIDNLALLDALVGLNAELSRANKARDAFLASMSHELRTPLNSVIGFSSILLQGLAGELNAEQRKQIGMINDSGRHLLTLVSNVLDLAKIEAGKVELDFETIDIAALARSLADSMRPMAEVKGLALRTDLPEDMPEVTTDRVKLSQILLNLLSNAVKYTEHGSVEIGLRAEDDSNIAIWVRDTGVGIPRESQAVIFEQFHQLPPTGRGAKYVGAGLGLAISQQVSHLLGGKIDLQSEVDVGSTFTLTLPIDHDDRHLVDFGV